jgi:Mg2+/Co2+ transporter CorC
LEADGLDTIGGFIFNRLGYLPPSGTRFEMPRLAVTIRRAGRKRIEEILLEKTTCLSDCESADGNGATQS